MNFVQIYQLVISFLTSKTGKNIVIFVISIIIIYIIYLEFKKPNYLDESKIKLSVSEKAYIDTNFSRLSVLNNSFLDKIKNSIFMGDDKDALDFVVFLTTASDAALFYTDSKCIKSFKKSLLSILEDSGFYEGISLTKVLTGTQADGVENLKNRLKKLSK